MTRKTLPSPGPTVGVLRVTKSRFNQDDSMAIWRFNCGHCGQKLPELIRSSKVLPYGDVVEIWIETMIAGPWWRWDGDILRPTKLHIEERKKASVLLHRATSRADTDGLRRSLAHHSPKYFPGGMAPARAMLWRRPRRSLAFHSTIEPAPERIECPNCRIESRVIWPVATQHDVV
jgi:hypothetical protein